MKTENSKAPKMLTTCFLKDFSKKPPIQIFEVAVIFNNNMKVPL